MMTHEERQRDSEKRIADARETFVESLMQKGFGWRDADELWRLAFLCGEMSGHVKATIEAQTLISKMLGAAPKLALLGVLLLGGCSAAHSSGRPEAERVFMDQAGYVCFLIRDEDGKAVGGNCVRE